MFSTDLSLKSTKYNRNYFTLNIYKGSEIQYVQRNVMTVLTALANTGGISSIIFAAFSILMAGVSQKMFLISLVRKLFLYDEHKFN